MNPVLHKLWLGTVFALGVAGIDRSKSAEMDPIQAAMVPAAVLLVYPAILWLFRSRHRRLEPEAVGDNCYYLGFLFTLVSLAFTLYRLPTPTPDAPIGEAVRGVVSGFGLALSSTIVGILLRILHLRMRPDTDVLSHDARRTLEVAVADFRDNLVRSNRMLNDAAVEVAQVLSEQRDDIRKLATENVAAQQAAMTESVHAHITMVGDALREATPDAVAAIRESIAAAFAAGPEALASSVEEFRTAVADLLKKEIETVAALASLAGNLDSAGKDMAERFDSAVGAVSTFRERAAEATDALAANTALMSDAARRLGELAGEVEAAHARRKGIFGAIRRLLAPRGD